MSDLNFPPQPVVVGGSKKETDGKYGSYEVHETRSDYPKEGESREDVSKRLFKEVMLSLDAMIKVLRDRNNKKNEV